MRSDRKGCGRNAKVVPKRKVGSFCKGGVETQRWGKNAKKKVGSKCKSHSIPLTHFAS